MDKEPMPQVDVEDVTIEELLEFAGADCTGSFGTIGCATTPTCFGCFGCYGCS